MFITNHFEMFLFVEVKGFAFVPMNSNTRFLVKEPRVKIAKAHGWLEKKEVMIRQTINRLLMARRGQPKPEGQARAVSHEPLIIKSPSINK